jgi:hyaluronoglucosaminidase
MPDPASVFGVVEGFYGVFYTFPQRVDLIRFIASCGYNAYLYAPKNDRQHRTRWWEAYPPQIMQQFAGSIEIAMQSGVDFAYGISPGQSICYTSSDDFKHLIEKLQAFYEIGVRSFSLLLDDIRSDFRNASDRLAYSNLALAQADLGNRVYDWLITRDPQCHLSFCPVDYSGSAPFSPALHQLGVALHPAIDIFYTGPEICTPTITTADINAYAEVVRRPPLIWDNYPVNDLSMSPELHLGPVQGRDPGMRSAARGLYVNPMLQAEATKIPLATYAAFMAAELYQPEIEWEKALKQIAGADYAETLHIFCNHAISSFLHPDGFHGLVELVQNIIHDLRCCENIDESTNIKLLETQLDTVDEACYHLKYRMENLALRDDLLPWIEVLEHWIWMTRRAFEVLRASTHGQRNPSALSSLLEYRGLIQRHPRRVPVEALLLLIEYALEQDEKLVSAEARQTQKRRWPRFSFPRFNWRKSSKLA